MRTLILLCLLQPMLTFAESSVWKVSHEATELYLGGTIHVLGVEDYPLPQEFEQAYQKAEVIVLETDLLAMGQAEAQLQLLQKLRYPAGQSLRDDINDATYQQLVDYVATTALQLSLLETMRPPLVMITLTMAELQRLGIGDAGVDIFYNNRALQEGKPLKGLESVALQIEIIESMGKGHENEMILSTITELKDMAALMQTMKTAWRTGDLSQLEVIGIKPMRIDFPALYQSLLVERNNSWLPKIEAMLKTPETEFVLVGALHLVAEEGIVQQLRDRGYQVEKLKDH
jgi:uncharacterized protein